MHDYLADETHKQYALVGYILENTLTDNGSVTRGICQSKDGLLSEVKECAKIEKHDCGVQYFENDEWVDVDAKSLVSMNMWGFYQISLKKSKRSSMFPRRKSERKSNESRIFNSSCCR